MNEYEKVAKIMRDVLDSQSSILKISTFDNNMILVSEKLWLGIAEFIENTSTELEMKNRGENETDS